jgi:hypothetical protein
MDRLLCAHPRLTRLALYGAALLASLGVLLLYTRPDFLVLVAEQVWACF